ncbi:glycoprotein [jopcycgri virus 1]|uniref:Glycoprotein n=1 Tax=jopcycgri virus 1 TaxID=2992924 RepID=A0A9E8AFN1_9RHAB|nr:glycoprotein [jopcycgri virus 1]
MKKTNSNLKRFLLSVNINYVNIKMELKHLSIFLYINISLGSEIVFPTKILSNWHIANFSNIQCPFHVQHLNLDHQPLKIPVSIYRPHSVNSLKVNGFLCHKVQKITHCNENWLFISEIKREIRPVRVTSQECLNALESKKLGRLSEESFPLESCAWNTVNSNSNDIIYLSYHPVSYDQYSMSFVDGIFIGGSTKEYNSRTIYESTIWIKDDNRNLRDCIELNPETGYVYQYKSHWYLWGETIKEQPLNHVCELRYCNRTGWMFRNGEWLTLNITKNDDLHYQIWNSHLEKCPETMPIKFAHEFDHTNTGLNMMLGLVLKLQCADVIEKLLSLNQINQLDISYLVQQYPGIGPAYKIEDSQLFTATGMYTVLDTRNLNLKENMIGNTLSGDEVYSDFNMVSTNVSYGINGLIKYKGRIILPLSSVYNYEISKELNRNLKMDCLDHPMYRIISNTSFEYSEMMFTKSNKTDLSTSIVTLVESFGNKLGAWIGNVFSSFNSLSIILVVTILLSILILLYKMVKFGVSYNQQQSLKRESNTLLRDSHQSSWF